jgi:ubiquinone/menaquinone biosynthesis C-methylase UbiE
MKNSQYAYAGAVQQQSLTARRWLDIGCGHSVVPEWTSLADALRPDAGVDLDRASVSRNERVRWRIVASGEALPFAGSTFDLVTANMVLEHVADPGRLFREVARVLAPGGTFVAHTPRAFGYTTLLARAVPQGLRPALARCLHDRAEEDVYPTHYRANTKRALDRLAEAAGLRADVRGIGTSPQLARVPIAGRLEHFFIKTMSPRPCFLCRFTK